MFTKYALNAQRTDLYLVCLVSLITVAMSSYCREVVTLQLGHYSNYVGTHWWNLQVSVSVLFLLALAD